MNKSLAGFGATGNLMTSAAGNAPPAQPVPPPDHRPAPTYTNDRPKGHPAHSPTPGATRPSFAPVKK